MALIRAVLFANLLVGLVYGQTCYFPNGTAEVAPYRVCNPDAEFSSCCAPDDECLTNGLCRPTNSKPLENDYWRDGCTDPTWKAPECGKYCYNSTTGSAASSINFFVNSCSADTYCCANVDEWASSVGYSCCGQASLVFKAGPPKWLSGQEVAISYIPVPSSTATSRTTSQTATSRTTQSSQTSTSSSSSSSSPTSTNTSSGSGLSTGASAAIGTVLGVAAIAAIIAGIFFYRRRQKRQRTKQSTEGSGAWADAPNTSAPGAVYAYYDPPLASNKPDNNQPFMPQTQELDGQTYGELPANSPAGRKKGPTVQPSEMP